MLKYSMRNFIDVIVEAQNKPPLPVLGERPWWIEPLASLTKELSNENWSWLEGGCFAFADRLRKAYGGQLWAMARYDEDFDEWNADHAVVKINGQYYDYNGVFDPETYAVHLAKLDKFRNQGPYRREMMPKSKINWFEDEWLDQQQWDGLLRVLKTGLPYA